MIFTKPFYCEDSLNILMTLYKVTNGGQVLLLKSKLQGFLLKALLINWEQLFCPRLNVQGN